MAKPTRSLRRALRFGAVLLALGVLSTVLTTWALAAREPGGARVRHSSGRAPHDIRRAILLTRVDFFGAAGFTTSAPLDGERDSAAIRAESLQPRWVRPLLAAYWRHPETCQWYRVIAHGWPLPALYYTEAIFSGNVWQAAQTELDGGFKIPRQRKTVWSRTPSEVVLPWRPVWAGIAINSAWWGMLWGVLVLIPAGVRRTIWGWRGRCPKCGYDLRGQAIEGCPECGWKR